MAQQISPRSDLAGQPPPPRPDDAPRRWLDALADQGPASVIIDAAGKLLFANAAYQALVQSIDSNLSGEVGEAAIIPRKLLLRVLNGEGPLESRQMHKNSHGIVATQSRYWLLPGENGHGQEIAGNIFDESREVDALRIRRQARARFDYIARLTSDWVWEVNELFAFTFVSSRVTDVLGSPAQALLGKDLFKTGQFDGFEEANRGDHPKPDSRIPFSDIAYRMKVADGGSCLFELSGVPIFDDRSGRFMAIAARPGTSPPTSRRKTAPPRPSSIWSTPSRACPRVSSCAIHRIKFFSATVILRKLYLRAAT